MSNNSPYTGEISENEFQHLRVDQRFLVREILQRGGTATLFDYFRGIVEVTLAGRREFLFDIDSSIISCAASAAASNKQIAKKLLYETGVQTPHGELFTLQTRYEALNFAEEIGFPCVLKPVAGVKGQGVYTDLNDAVELDQAIDDLYLEFGTIEFLVEKQFTGQEYRVFITRDGYYAVLEREPAFVIGDGENCIEELASLENERRDNPRRNALCPIAIDTAVSRFLAKRGLSLESVPLEKQKITLRGNSNLATGGYCRDATEIIHPSVIEICRSVLARFSGMPYAGIDFMSNDIRLPQTPERYQVIEVNPMPSIAMHMGPAEGTPRNTAALLADLIYPETRKLPKITDASPIPKI